MDVNPLKITTEVPTNRGMDKKLVEHYSAARKAEILLFAAAGMALESTIPNEVNLEDK